MKEDVSYYHILDLNMIGKDQGYVPYLYHPGAGWVVDRDNILTDRLMGYDGGETAGTSYGIGCTDVMGQLQRISEEEAGKLIAAAEGRKMDG